MTHSHLLHDIPRPVFLAILLTCLSYNAVCSETQKVQGTITVLKDDVPYYKGKTLLR